MSKWLKVFILSLLSLGGLWLSAFLYQSDAAYRSRGVVTTVAKEVRFTEERNGLLAHLRYVDQRGAPVSFTRFVSPELAAALRAGRPVLVEYLPGEWNSERFAGSDSGAGPWALATLAAMVALVLVLRRPASADAPAPGAPARAGPLAFLLAWAIRGGILLLAVGGLLAGGAGLVGGAGTQDVVLLLIGVLATAVFVVSLRLRLA